MDNICHTLVGVAAARAGLATKTSLATATLAIASNLPDIDVLAFTTGIPAVALRRGWTHGVLAQAVLPIAFAGVMWMVARGSRARDSAARGSGPGTEESRANFRDFLWLLALSYLGVICHVFMDYLNTYGVRLLMPISNQWFYGDSVFIVDVWMWLMLGLGALVAQRGTNLGGADRSRRDSRLRCGNDGIRRSRARNRQEPVGGDRWSCTGVHDGRSGAGHSIQKSHHRRRRRPVRRRQIRLVPEAHQLQSRGDPEERSGTVGAGRARAGAGLRGDPRLGTLSVLAARRRRQRHPRHTSRRSLPAKRSWILCDDIHPERSACAQS